MSATQRIYADYAATTPMREEVLQAMLPYFSEGGYNASSTHAEGRRARSGLDNAREEIAGLLGARASEIVFTAGGSEADNLAVFGVARARKDRGRHLVSSTIEHHAIEGVFEALAEEGFDVTMLSPNTSGTIGIEKFSQALRDDTIFASLMMVNNELGTINPIAACARIARERNVIFHTDAVQAASYLPVNVKELNVDLLSLAAHKFYGPKGIGILYVRSGTPIAPLILGGGQEFGKRSGTPNVAAAVGMAAAFRLARAEMEIRATELRALRGRFEEEVRSHIEDVRINGAEAERAPFISNISFAGIIAEQLAVRLDLEGVAVSTGSACTSGALESSHVIAALQVDPRWQTGAIRFSFGRGTTQEQVDRLISIVERTVRELRTFSAKSA